MLSRLLRSTKTTSKRSAPWLMCWFHMAGSSLFFLNETQHPPRCVCRRKDSGPTKPVEPRKLRSCMVQRDPDSLTQDICINLTEYSARKLAPQSYYSTMNDFVRARNPFRAYKKGFLGKLAGILCTTLKTRFLFNCHVGVMSPCDQARSYWGKKYVCLQANHLYSIRGTQ